MHYRKAEEDTFSACLHHFDHMATAFGGQAYASPFHVNAFNKGLVFLGCVTSRLSNCCSLEPTGLSYPDLIVFMAVEKTAGLLRGKRPTVLTEVMLTSLLRELIISVDFFKMK